MQRDTQNSSWRYDMKASTLFPLQASPCSPLAQRRHDLFIALIEEHRRGCHQGTSRLSRSIPLLAECMTNQATGHCSIQARHAIVACARFLGDVNRQMCALHRLTIGIPLVGDGEKSRFPTSLAVSHR